MKTLENPEEIAALTVRLGRMAPDSERRWGRMTAHQTICHLADSFDVALGAKKVSRASGLFQSTVMKWGALYFPMRWPKGVPTRPEIEQGAGRAFGGTLPDDFERDRLRLIRIIGKFAASQELQGRFHPIFGPLTTAQWHRWGYLHTDHHLRQFGV